MHTPSIQILNATKIREILERAVLLHFNYLNSDNSEGRDLQFREDKGESNKGVQWMVDN
jgi:hypothetical protein